MTTAAPDPLSHTASYRVRFDEAGPDGLVRTSGLLRYAQDVAWRHSEALGFDRAWYSERGLAWVVRAAELEVAAAMRMGVTLEVTTRVLGFQRIWARRRAECRLPSGEPAAWIQTDWVLIDARGRLARVPAEIVDRFPAPLLDEPIMRVSLTDGVPGSGATRSRVRQHELDPMNHVNNAVYVDWLEDALLGAGDAGAELVQRRPRRIRLEYAAAGAPGTEVTTAVWPSTGRWEGRIADAAETDLVRATIAVPEPAPGSLDEPSAVDAGQPARAGGWRIVASCRSSGSLEA